MPTSDGFEPEQYESGTSMLSERLQTTSRLCLHSEHDDQEPATYAYLYEGDDVGSVSQYLAVHILLFLLQQE